MVELGKPVKGKYKDVPSDYDFKNEYARVTGEYIVERWWWQDRVSEYEIASRIVSDFEAKSGGEGEVRYTKVVYIGSEDLGYGKFRDHYQIEVHIYAKGLAPAVIVGVLLAIGFVIFAFAITFVWTPDKVQKVLTTVTKTIEEAGEKAGGLAFAGLGALILIIIIILLLRRR